MKFHVFTFNPFAENTYLIEGKHGNSIIVDPGMADERELDILSSFLEQHGLILKRCILTHCHIDHVLGTKAVSDKYGLRAECHTDSKPIWESCPTVSQMYGIAFSAGPEPEYNLKAGDKLMLDGEELEMRFVPGHCPGHLVFIDHEGKKVIAGDTLFRQSIGRTDLPGGDHELLLGRIRTELYSLDDDYIVWPGHGPQTTIGFEKQNNPFL